MAHDEVEIVEFRAPVECLADQVGGGDDFGGIARATVGEADLEVTARYALYGVDHLEDGEAPGIAAVHDDRRPAAAQVGERVGVGLGEIPDVNVVTHAGAVRRGVVGAVDVEMGAFALGCLAGDLDEVGRALRRLAGAARGIGAGDIEVAQGDVAEVVRRGGVLQHGLGHQFRRAVGRDRQFRRCLGDGHGLRRAVDGGGGGEDEMAHALLDGAGHQRARLDRVVEIVAEGIGDRFGDDDRAGEVDDRVDPVFVDDAVDEGLVADVAFDEGGVLRDRPTETGRQVVEYDGLLAEVGKALGHV